MNIPVRISAVGPALNGGSAQSAACVELRGRRPDAAGRAGHRDPGGPGQHRAQLQVGDLRQVVGERGQPQREVDQGLRATGRVPR